MGLEREQRERIKEEEKGREGKTTREATKVIFHYFHVQRSHTYDINSRSNSTGEGHTVTGLLGSRTLRVRFRESARCQVVQTLLHSGAHRPAAGPGTPLRPPASKPHSPHFKWTNTGLVHIGLGSEKSGSHLPWDLSMLGSPTGCTLVRESLLTG